MATQNNFRRSNVNAKTLQITDPGRSSFNLGHKNELSIPFGKVIPVSHRILLPSDTFQGSIKPNLHLEKIATPSIGPTRLDTHTFVVNFRRINNQMRSNLEKGQNFFPSFNMKEFLLKYPFSPMVTAGPSTTTTSVLKDIYDLIASSPTIKNFVTKFWDRVVSSYASLVENTEVKQFRNYYQYDKLVYLYEYYNSCAREWTMHRSNAKDNNILELYTYAIIPFYKPWAGPSSLFDYLGYPVITQYSEAIAYYEELNRFITGDQWQSLSLRIFKAIGSQNDLNDFFTMRMYQKYTSSSDSLSTVTFDYHESCSELPLRAYYAVWYDYLRNWHIEERSQILDPDNFSNTALIGNLTQSALSTVSYWCSEFFKTLSLVLLRSRDYNSDFLNTIQTDDAFRHVYSPVFSIGSNDDEYAAASNKTGTATASTITGIFLPDYSGDEVYFPSDGSRISEGDNTCFAQDLQTMRRAGMLEKWLARNYYFPDTYVGRLQARFGVRPSDYEVLVSNYLGGSESFISGTELVANMSTSETIVGSRNLKADMSTQDNFSGTVSDYSYLISVVSTVPIISYDVLHPSVKTIDFVDFPQPEFATDTRVEARTADFLRGFQIKPFIGYVPRYYMFRTSADETHGRYLTDYRTFNWLRDAYSMSRENFEFSLNPYSLRVNLPLDAFIGLKPWDDFAYGDCDCQLVVNRALPAAIEVI